MKLLRLFMLRIFFCYIKILLFYFDSNSISSKFHAFYICFRTSQNNGPIIHAMDLHNKEKLDNNLSNGYEAKNLMFKKTNFDLFVCNVQ